MQTHSTPWSAHRRMEALAAMAQHGRIAPHLQALLVDLWSSIWQAHQRGQLFWSITTRGSTPTFGAQRTPVLDLVEAWRKVGGLEDATDDMAARITDRIGQHVRHPTPWTFPCDGPPHPHAQRARTDPASRKTGESSRTAAQRIGDS